MKRLLLGTCFLAGMALSSVAPVQGQYAWDVGVHLGGSNYLGEMGGKEQTRRDFVWDMKLNQTRWAVGGFARRKINRLISVNAGLMYLRVQGADDLSTNRARVGRNLNFRNDMFELYLRPEFTIYQDNDVGGRGRYKTDFRLFGYAGIAAFYHSPKAQLVSPRTGVREGEFYDLQPLTTEDVSYSKLGLAVPVGMGFHFTMKRRHRIGWDFGWRTTFTDYLDDASTIYVNPDLLPNDLARDLQNQNVSGLYLDNADIPSVEQYGYWGDRSDPGDNKRGDPTHNDSYVTMTLTYSYVLRGQSNFYRQRYSWIRGKKRIGRKSRAKF